MVLEKYKKKDLLATLCNAICRGLGNDVLVPRMALHISSMENMKAVLPELYYVL